VVGKILAAIGVALAVPAIWVKFLSARDGFSPAQNYWKITGVGHSIGVAMLVLVAVCGVLLIVSFFAPNTPWENAPWIPGLVLGGLLLFVPAEFAFNHLDLLKAGAWLGLASCVCFALGAILVAFGGPAPPGAFTPVRIVGLVLVAVGVLLVFSSVWPDWASGESYWRISEFGHSVGFALLILAGASGLLVLLSVLSLHGAIDRLAPVPGLVAGGLLVFEPAAASTSHLDELKLGGWLGVAACGVLALGSVLLLFARPPVPDAVRAEPAVPAAAPTGPPVQTAPAGWYPDPSRQAQLRYWSGSDWTDQTR
jgi:hypothetical protein